MILPKVRDPRFITVRRGGTLRDADHHLLALWAADCAEHMLRHFEQARHGDDRPRRAISLGRAWARGEVTWWDARAAGGHANAAARDLSGAARHAAYAAGQAAAVGHVAAHELGGDVAVVRDADGVGEDVAVFLLVGLVGEVGGVRGHRDTVFLGVRHGSGRQAH